MQALVIFWANEGGCFQDQDTLASGASFLANQGWAPYQIYCLPFRKKKKIYCLPSRLELYILEFSFSFEMFRELIYFRIDEKRTGALYVEFVLPASTFCVRTFLWIYDCSKLHLNTNGRRWRSSLIACRWSSYAPPGQEETCSALITAAICSWHEQFKEHSLSEATCPSWNRKFHHPYQVTSKFPPFRLWDDEMNQKLLQLHGISSPDYNPRFSQAKVRQPTQL